MNPWTLPNVIGLVRLALIPVFLIVALSSGDGVDLLAAIIFAVIGWSDYLDGIAARVTGQYSRLGALLDPVVDRLLVLSGVARLLALRAAAALALACSSCARSRSSCWPASRCSPARSEDQLAGPRGGLAGHVGIFLALWGWRRSARSCSSRTGVGDARATALYVRGHGSCNPRATLKLRPRVGMLAPLAT